MKRVILLLVILLISVSAFAMDGNTWYVGVSGDYLYNTLNSNTGYRINTTLSPGHSFSISIPVRYQINNWFGIESGIKYAQKNYSWTHKIDPYTNDRVEWENTTNHFLEFPLSLNFAVGNETIKSVWGLGGYLGVWLASHKQGQIINNAETVNEEAFKYINYDENIKFSSTSDNRFEYGLLFRGGIEVAVKPVVIFVRGSYYLGLSDLTKDYQKNKVSRYNNSITCELGVVIGFGGNK